VKYTPTQYADPTQHIQCIYIPTILELFIRGKLNTSELDSYFFCVFTVINPEGLFACTVMEQNIKRQVFVYSERKHLNPDSSMS